MPKISGLPSDTSPLVSDIVPMVDNTAVVTKKVLLSDLITTIFNNAPAVASSGWNTMSQAFTYGSNNGNKEFTVTTPNDVTGLLWPGMRMKFNRGTTPPTQSMAFTAASSQYASKATPSGITFTAAYTVEAWVDLKSYPTFGTILQRRDSPATGGFGFRIDGASGLLDSFYYSGSNLTLYQSKQTIPLNQMVHVATTVVPSTQTVLFYINGLLVTGQSVNLSSSILIQTGTLSAGGWADGASEFFDGSLSEVRLWSNVQSQSQIQANMTKNLVGNEANLVGLWQGNGSFNDLTVNANNLTPSGGAIATQTTNPYNTTEYGIITKISYVNPTTTITLFTGTDYMIPNMTLASPQYSTVRAPFGFPVAKNKWQIYVLFLTQSQTNGPGYNSWQFAGQQLSVPTGEWILSHSTGVTETASSSALGIGATLSTTNNSSSDKRFESYLFHSSAVQLSGQLIGRASVSLTTQTVYYNNVCITSGSSTVLFVNAVPGGTISQISYILAECAYL